MENYFIKITGNVNVWVKEPGAIQLAGKLPLISTSGRQMIKHKPRTGTGRVNTGNPETQTDRCVTQREHTTTEQAAETTNRCPGSQTTTPASRPSQSAAYVAALIAERQLLRLIANEAQVMIHQEHRAGAMEKGARPIGGD